MSSNRDESSFEVDSPVSCYQLKFIAAICFIIFILSVALNSLLMYALIKYKEFKNALNSYVLALTGLNLIASFTELPLVIASNFYCK